MANVTRITGRVLDAIARRRQRRRERHGAEQAAAELHRYSDVQLQDLGLRRDEIDNAVRYGRSDNHVH